MSLAPTANFGLPQYKQDDDMDYNEVNTAFSTIDRLAAATVCTAGTRPVDDLFVGRLIYETDTGKVYMWKGTGWLFVQTDPEANDLDAKNMYRGSADSNQSKASGTTVGVTIVTQFTKVDSFAQVSASYVRRIVKAGVYRITGQVTWAAGGTGTRTMELKKNINTGPVDFSTGTTLARSQNPPDAGSGLITCNATVTHQFAANDTVAFGALQTSGGPLDIIGTDYQTFLEIEYLRS